MKQANPKPDVRWYWQFVAPFRRNYAVMLLLMLAQCLVTLGVTGIQKFFVDDVILVGRYERLPALIAVFVVLIILFMLLYIRVAHYVFLNRMDSKHLITRSLMDAILRLPQAVFQQERTSTYVHHMTHDADSIAQVLSNRIPRGLQHLFYVFSIFMILSQMGPMIVIVTAALIVFYVWIGKYSGPMIKRISREVNDERIQLGVVIEEGISSTREVISYNRQQWEMDKYHSGFARYFRKVMEEGRKSNLQLFMTEPTKWGIHVAVLGFGGYAVIRGDLSIGMFLVAYQYIAQLVNSFQNLFNFSMDLTRGVASADRLKTIMRQAESHSGTLRLGGPVNHIRFQQIHFTYPSQTTPVFEGLSMDIPAGHKIALVGVSGGGKSTLLQMLLRTISPQQGQVFINQQPLEQLAADDWNRRLAIVLQEPYFFPDTVRRNVTFGMDITEQEMIDACRKAQIHETIIRMTDGYDSVLGERGITMSGGQRQRLALARAMLRNPEILVLDEATSALDLETERRVMQALDQDRQGKTTILIAHRLSTIKNADLIYFLAGGQMEHCGSYEELYSRSSAFRRLAELDEEQLISSS
ncbi:MAG: ATP-binding cassette protein [Paenibacillus sp.]|jgi:ABC-type multidrug transport system fused ATPase/permease subunit|uniref:ABC transporter ATP-binding protein n=1 Tax=Paenibacillus sp. GCM10012303 TaxID=3317340 RepID=UPI0029F3EACF|nr:ATP-binding cassette protein [Paenibacillus sp.]